MVEELVVLDFETTGLSTDYDRIIEVGAAIVKGKTIQSTFSVLCDPGIQIPSFITGLTGISNAMVKGKPEPEEVMLEFYDYIGNRPLLAHNASFDTRFLQAEMARIGKRVNNPSLCTMLLSRRLIHDTTDHKLGTLKRYVNYISESDHKDHRALDDVKVTVSLWIHLRALIEKITHRHVLSFNNYQKLSHISKYKLQAFLEKLSEQPLDV